MIWMNCLRLMLVTPASRNLIVRRRRALAVPNSTWSALCISPEQLSSHVLS
jgi:hypothetical protein